MTPAGERVQKEKRCVVWRCERHTGTPRDCRMYAARSGGIMVDAGKRPFLRERDHCKKGWAECAGCAKILGVEMEASRQLLHRTDREIAAELGLEVRIDAEWLDQTGTGVQRTAAQQKPDRWDAIHTVAWRRALGESVRLLTWDIDKRLVSGHIVALTTLVYACALHYAKLREQAGAELASCVEALGPPTEWKRGGREAAAAASGMGVKATEEQGKGLRDVRPGEKGERRHRRAAECGRHLALAAIHLLPEEWPEKREVMLEIKGEGEDRPAQVRVGQEGADGVDRRASGQSISSASPASGERQKPASPCRRSVGQRGRRRAISTSRNSTMRECTRISRRPSKGRRRRSS